MVLEIFQILFHFYTKSQLISKLIQKGMYFSDTTSGCTILKRHSMCFKFNSLMFSSKHFEHKSINPVQILNTIINSSTL